MIDVAKNELPKLWKECDLEEVVRVIRGISFKSSEKLFEPGENTIVCLRTANVQEEVDWNNLWWVPEKFVKRDEQLIQKNDILMSNANSYELVGKVSLVRSIPEKVTLGAFITMLRAEKDVDPRFIFYQLRSSRVVKEIRSRASTTTNISNVSTGKLRDIPLWVAPLEQQKRIAAKIEELFSHIDAGIASLQAAKKLLKQYRQSVLKAAVTGELTKDWRKANKDKLEPASQLLERILKERRQRWEQQQLEQFKAKGKLPKDDKWKGGYQEPSPPDRLDTPRTWVTASLDQLTEYVTSGSRGWAKFYSESGARFIRAKNLKFDSLDMSDIAHVTLPDKTEGMRTRVKCGDLLVTITGANVTKTGYVDADLNETYVSQHVALCRPIKVSSTRYLHTYIVSKDGARQILEAAAYGAGKPGLNLDNLKSLQIALPSIGEQDEILRLADQRFLSIERLDVDLDAQIKKTTRSKQSILISAFTGELLDEI